MSQGSYQGFVRLLISALWAGHEYMYIYIYMLLATNLHHSSYHLMKVLLTHLSPLALQELKPDAFSP